MFGYAPQLSFKGQTAFTTYPGVFVSIIMYGLMILNFVQLSTAFQNGSKLNQSFNKEVIDRFTADSHYFSNNGFEIAVLTDVAITEEMGRTVAYQIQPCQENNGDCELGTRIRGGEGVPFSNCTSEKLDDIRKYWVKTKGEAEGLMFANNALCLDMEDFYLTGEPETNSEASFVVNFEFNPDYQARENK